VRPALVDDHLLVRALAGAAPAPVRRAHDEGRLWTTGIWYYRAVRALGSPRITGAITGELAKLAPSLQAAALRAVGRLPEDIGLLSFRDLAPSMARFSERHALNLLSLEALAAAASLDAQILVAAENDGPSLRRAAADERLGYAAVRVR
jgi:hypothetical protein